MEIEIVITCHVGEVSMISLSLISIIIVCLNLTFVQNLPKLYECYVRLQKRHAENIIVQSSLNLKMSKKPASSVGFFFQASEHTMNRTRILETCYESVDDRHCLVHFSLRFTAVGRWQQSETKKNVNDIVRCIC